MLRVTRSAHKLFDETTYRRALLGTSLYSLWRSTVCSASTYFEGSVGFSDGEGSVVCWTSKISNLVNHNRHKEAIDTFKLMLEHQQRPNYVTALIVTRAIGALRLKNMIWVIHGFVITMGFESELSVATTMMRVYANYDMTAVWKLFSSIPIKDLVSWSSMVSLCVKSGEHMEAIQLFRKMFSEGQELSYVSVVSVLPACAKLQVFTFGEQLHGLSIKRGCDSLTIVQNSLIDMYAKCGALNPLVRVFAKLEEKDLITWKTTIRGCIENEYPVKALNLFFEMRSSCFDLDESIVCYVIGAVSEVEKQMLGIGLHGYALKSGFIAFISVGTAFLQMYAKFGMVDLARTLFNDLNTIDLIAWSAMISVYAKSEQPCGALDVFKQMQLANQKPNEITFVSLLQACSAIGAQVLGESIHGYVTKAGYLPNAFLLSALIDLYCKFGRITQGKALFDKSPIKDLICWSSLISGYGLNGFGSEALETFSNMLDCGIRPNEVVFVSVLSACSHCGLQEEGWYLYYSMQETYGITPNLAHCACMVDLLSRRGNVEEAIEFVNKMPMEPDKRIWGAILAGCRLSRGSIEIAELVVERLTELDPENTSYYVNLSNLYADQGRWQDVGKLRKLIGEKGVRKMTGYSIVGASWS
ncbi:hypothetical protein Nepgr_024313 [Nepenthes gracilis]|uniref:Pentatricopeptide repeat-containing protein n=1 Tax=Nepenthes gracilis TaxID=150966 RepID=A0AAD3XZY2_NEPGR|nr:hypothetical protein Nepgr_024313 [Nepenthes gracilis]